MFSQHAGGGNIKHSNIPRFKTTGKHMVSRVECNRTGAFLGGTEVIKLSEKPENSNKRFGKFTLSYKLYKY